MIFGHSSFNNILYVHFFYLSKPKFTQPFYCWGSLRNLKRVGTLACKKRKCIIFLPFSFSLSLIYAIIIIIIVCLQFQFISQQEMFCFFCVHFGNKKNYKEFSNLSSHVYKDIHSNFPPTLKLFLCRILYTTIGL